MLAAAVAVAGALWWTYGLGDSAGADRITAAVSRGQDMAIKARDEAEARRAETALSASRKYEVDRDAIRARLRTADSRLAAALDAVDCAVPADALRGVRRAAGQLEPDTAADADASESRPPVP